MPRIPHAITRGRPIPRKEVTTQVSKRSVKSDHGRQPSEQRAWGVLACASSKDTCGCGKKRSLQSHCERCQRSFAALSPSEIPLGPVVGKRNAQVDKPCQHLLDTQEQGIQLILGLALLAPACARPCIRGGRWRLSGIASRQNLAHSERCSHQRSHESLQYALVLLPNRGAWPRPAGLGMKAALQRGSPFRFLNPV
jgi:hypothetical protein